MTFFKVLTIVVSGSMGDDDRECNLHTFSSTKPSRSAPRKCFNKMWGLPRVGFSFQQWNDNAVVDRGVAHLLIWYFSEDGDLSKYYTFDMSAKTDHT